MYRTWLLNLDLFYTNDIVKVMGYFCACRTKYIGKCILKLTTNQTSLVRRARAT